MRIGCLQFAPQVGDVENNLNRADAVLSRVDPMDIENLDLLVLPEMAFSGYNFKSLQEITPFLEPSGSGISSLWARTTALKYDCVVAVGYPERVRQQPFGEDYYNSLIVVNGDGETVANYRKSSLYYTDETWASEGGGFYQGEIQDLGKVAMGICMDINPYKFQTPWTAFEFGFHILEARANLVIISMAWLTQEDARTFTRLPQEPDIETLTYWVQRMEPIIRAEGEEEIIVVFANRCGTEGNTVYAGTSAVLGVQNGEVSVYGLLGRGTKELLVVNTEMPPFAKLVNRPDGSPEDEDEVTAGDRMSDSAASAQEGAKYSNGQKSPARALASFAEDVGFTDNEHETEGGPVDAGYSNPPSYATGRSAPGPRAPASPRDTRTSVAQPNYEAQDQPSPKEARSYRRTASPRDDYSPKESPVFRRAASPRDGYSPGLTSSRDGYSPVLASNRGANSPGIPSPKDFYASRVPSPREWYGVTENPASGSPDNTGSPGLRQARGEDQVWGNGELADLASPTFPEPTPMSMRPKLAISTGPETLPPVPRRAPPRGVQPGNFFSSRDLCTPPETPFDEEPQPFTQQHWVPPSAFTYTPEEPQWPDTVAGEGGYQLPARRPSPANVSNKIDFSRTPARTVPTRPASRTQEVKWSDLDDARPNARQEPDQPSKHGSSSRHPSRARAPDRRATPAVGEGSTPRLRSKRAEPTTTRSRKPSSRDDTDRARGLFEREDRRPEIKVLPSPPPVQQTLLAREPDFPSNSITIAASPSVFKTEFQRSETFPRTDSPRERKGGTRHGGHSAAGGSERDRLKRSKSISTLRHGDPADYLPSPALPVHKAYQDMIYSAVEPAVSIDSMWAAAAAAAAPPLPKKRHASVSSERGPVVLPLGRAVRPDILSPMSV